MVLIHGLITYGVGDHQAGADGDIGVPVYYEGLRCSCRRARNLASRHPGYLEAHGRRSAITDLLDERSHGAGIDERAYASSLYTDGCARRM